MTDVSNDRKAGRRFQWQAGWATLLLALAAASYAFGFEGAFLVLGALALVALLAAYATARRDARAHLQTVADLRASDQRLRLTLDALHGGVLMFDARGTVIDGNQSAERILQMPLARMQGYTLDDWPTVDAQGRPLPRDQMPIVRALETGVAQRDYTLGNQDPTGSIVWMSVSAMPLQEDPAGRGQGVVVSFVDITERRRAEAELVAHQERLEERVAARTRELSDALAARAQTDSFVQAVIDNIPGRVGYWDTTLTCRYANRHFAEYFGRPRETLLGSTLGEALGADRYAGMEPLVREALRGRPQQFETDDRWPDGRLSRSQVHLVPDDRGGTVQGMFVLALDVTQMRADQHSLQRLNEALVIARDKAEEAAGAKTVFLANMSHEIRTPMNAIIGLTHLMRRDAPAPHTAERLERLAHASQHLLGILNNILDLSKIESGKLVLEQVDFNLDALLTRTCGMIAEAAADKGLELVIDSDDTPRTLRGDATRLSQALVNLLSNAVKFTEHGSISVRARPEASYDGLVRVRFEVRDTGIGIDPAKIEAVFSDFEQADTTTTRRYGGTGLGLGITRHLARLMGGEAGATSVAGVGSTFWFTAELEAGDLKPARAADHLLANLHALLVDDMPEVREVMVAMLEQLGLRTESADSGAAALELADAAARRGDPYDVLLIDWLMPHMDGIETARRLLAQATGKAPACIMVSGLHDAKMRAMAMELGITSILEKPVSFSTLHDQLLEQLVARTPGLRGGAVESAAEEALRQEHRGARVLLAEDNPVNQDVARTLLEAAGLEVDVAVNGLEAVAHAGARHYDLILMDVQMPELDGLGAARMLRSQVATAGVPIIAMTANAYAEDRADCLAAGMNDHVAKPVDPPLLYTMLSRWLPRAGRYAPQHLDSARGLAFFAGKKPLYARALGQFAGLYAGGIGGTEAWLVARDATTAEVLRRELHSVGGASATLGAQGIAAQAKALGDALRSDPTSVSQGAALKQLQRDLADLVTAIQADALEAGMRPAQVQ